MSTAAFDPVVVEQRAHKQALQADIAKMAGGRVSLIGACYIAAAVGLGDARPLYSWRAGEVTPKSRMHEDRLRALYRTVTAIAEAYSPSVAAAFLRSVNPELGDRSPVEVLADDDDGP